MTDSRRLLPSISSLLETRDIQSLLLENPRTIVVDALRTILDAARQFSEPLSDAEIFSRAIIAVSRGMQPTLRRVINATGVVLHTNLGRAPLPSAAIQAINASAVGYSNLEYNLEEGVRGSRYSHCVSLLKELTGAEDAIVVNNCAAALVLALSTLAGGKEAIVSRGELVEIGGSFRIPDIMNASGARMVEIGTTNRTHVDDYIRAIGKNTGAIIKVHRSNFALQGFVAEVAIDRLVPIAAERDIPVIYDLGSGLLVSLEKLGLKGEPIASEVVSAGTTLVLMSGDKLLGGPQAGIIVGKASAIAKLKTNPLARAMRVDKLTIAALSATLQLYRDPDVMLSEIPTLKMFAQSVDELRTRAERIRVELEKAQIRCEIKPSDSSVGAGAFPTTTLESCVLAFAGNANTMERKLRAGNPPVIGRIADGELLLDMRSVLPDEDSMLGELVIRALQ